MHLRIILILSLFSSTCLYCKNADLEKNVNGKVRLHFQLYGIDSTFDVPDVFYDVLYHDSCLIFQCKQIYTNQNPTVRIKAELQTLHYTFINLRTKNCQDYLSLEDTSTPFTNYLLDSMDFPYWKFFRDFPSKIDKTPLIPLPDTIIESHKYSRTKHQLNVNGQLIERILYHGCTKYPNYFHLYIENCREDDDCCRTVRLDDFVDGSLSNTLRIENISNELSKKEQRIFSVWMKNSIKIKIPQMTFGEASKTISRARTQSQ